MAEALSRTPRKRLFARILLALVFAPLVVLALLSVAELALAAAGVAPRRTNFERIREAEGTESLVASKTPPHSWTLFTDQRIPVRRKSGIRRVLFVGESTVAGYPFQPPAAFCYWVEARLEKLLPDLDFEVLNLGVNGWNCEAVRDLVAEIGPSLEPDLYVVYSGHNEYLDANIFAIKFPIRHGLQRIIESFHFGRLLLSWSKPRWREIDQPLRNFRYSGLLDEPLIDAAEMSRAFRNYERNARDIVHIACRQDAGVVFCLPVCDLRDTIVNCSSFSAATPLEVRESFRKKLLAVRVGRVRLEDARKADPSLDLDLPAQDLLREIDELEKIDATVGTLPYERGRLLVLLRRYREARKFFEEARDVDQQPVRATRFLHDILVRVAREEGALIADPRARFDAADPIGIPGQDKMFVDICHPDMLGHPMIADSIIQALSEHDVFAPKSSWRFAEEPTEEQYFRQLGLSNQVQARTCAMRALTALLQGYFSSERESTLKKADGFFKIALKQDPDCALAHAGLGFLEVMRGNKEAALSLFEHARSLDPASLKPFEDGCRRHPLVKEMFAKAELCFVDGKVEGTDTR